MTRAEKNKKKKISRILSWIGNIIVWSCGTLAVSTMFYIGADIKHLSEKLAHTLFPYGFVTLMVMIIGFILLTITWKYEGYFRLYKMKLLAEKEAHYSTQFMKYFHDNNLEKANFYFDLLKYEPTKNSMIGFIRGTLYGNPDKTKSDEILRGFYEKTYKR